MGKKENFKFVMNEGEGREKELLNFFSFLLYEKIISFSYHDCNHLKKKEEGKFLQEILRFRFCKEKKKLRGF